MRKCKDIRSFVPEYLSKELVYLFRNVALCGVHGRKCNVRNTCKPSLYLIYPSKSCSFFPQMFYNLCISYSATLGRSLPFLATFGPPWIPMTASGCSLPTLTAPGCIWMPLLKDFSTPGLIALVHFLKLLQ